MLQAPEKTVRENTMKKAVLHQPMENCAGIDIYNGQSGQPYARAHGHFLKPLESPWTFPFPPYKRWKGVRNEDGQRGAAD